MKTYDFSPFYRSSIGFDRLFDLLDRDTQRAEWPPYNIEKLSDDDYRITMAVAGFAEDEIQLTQHGSALHVEGRKKAEQESRTMLHQGIASRAFKQSFSLADYVKVSSASLENGLLSINLLRQVPEQFKPRQIEIRSTPGLGASDRKVEQIETPREQRRQAA